MLKQLALLVIALPLIFADRSDRPLGKRHHEKHDHETITPEAGPRVVNGIDLFLMADFLYWIGRQEGLAIAQTGVGANAGDLANSTSVQTQGQTYYIPKKYKPGFRIGLGFDLFQDGWDTQLIYTWYHGKGTLNLSTTSNTDDFIAIWSLGTQQAQTGTRYYWKDFNSCWKLRLNNFDYELGRNYYISHYLSLRNHIGLKGGWYDQDFDLTQNHVNPTVDTENIGQAHMLQKQDFWWIGLRSGLDSTWHLGKSWSIVGDLSLSGVWGRFDVSRKDDVQLKDAPADPFTWITTVNTTNKFYTIKPVLELLLGLKVDWWTAKDKLHFSVLAAWENQTWFNQNNYIEFFGPSGNNGDLIFQGFTLQGRFDF